MAEQHFAEEFSAEQYREYKPISKAAVGAFICALIGSLAPVAPALLAFEIAAVVLALVALNVIKQQLRSGKTLAFLALLSGTLIIGLIPSRELKRRYDYRSTAREHASSWLQLIQDGQFREAHQLTYYVDERRAPGVSWDEHYRPPTTAKRVQEDEISDEIDPYTAFMDFFAHPPASWLKTEHDEVDIQCRGVTSMLQLSESIRLTVVFDVHRTNGSTHAIRVEMQRGVDQITRESHWRVNALTDVDTPDS
mgnify:CR=1 FL=1